MCLHGRVTKGVPFEENSQGGGYFVECLFPLGPAIYCMSSNCAQQVLG